MQGSLTETNVADVVVRIFLERRSGILRLTQSEVKKSIYFKDGRIVFAHSNLKNERLGEVLLRLGKITEDEFRMVSKELEEGRRLGQILYEKGLLSPSEINSGVSYQIQQILFSVFNWDFGQYEFVDRDRPVFEDIMVEVSTPAMVMDAIRNITNLAVLERAIGIYEDQIVRPGTGEHRLPRTNLDFSEETILACVDNKATLKQLRGITRLASHEFGRAIYSLVSCGMIRFDNSPVEEIAVDKSEGKEWRGDAYSTQKMPPKEKPQLQPAVAPRRQKTYTEGEMRDLIHATSIRFQEATDEEVLNVLPDATREEIQSAFDTLTDIFHPPYYSADRFRDLKDSLKGIIDRVQEAFHNMLEKESLQQPLLDGIPHGPVPQKPILIHPEPEPAPPVVNPKPLTVADLEPSPLPEMKEEEASIPSAQSREPAESVVTEAPSQTLSLAELEESIKNEPVNASLYRQLGKRLQQGGKAREAERNLLRALEIEPRNVESHFSLADFYQAQGLKFKAFKHLNIVLQLDPKNKKALDLLGVKKRKNLYDISASQ